MWISNFCKVGFTIVAFSFYNLNWITSNDEKCKCYLSRYRKMVLGVFLYLVGWLYVTLLLLQRFFGIERLQIFTSITLYLFNSIPWLHLVCTIKKLGSYYPHRSLKNKKAGKALFQKTTLVIETACNSL